MMRGPGLWPARTGEPGWSSTTLTRSSNPTAWSGLRATAQAMLPRVDLPELLLEVHAWTGFLDAYTHLADVSTRTKDLAVSVAALLVAEACNVGLTPVIKPGEAALSRARLAHVDQYYVRAENHAAANALLIEAQTQIPIAQAWGGGLLASVDGLRFVVPVRTINAGPSPRYFGYKRGITWLNAVNDQVAGIGQMVVPGTPRDSLFILDTLLNLDAGPKPEVVTTDNASYSDMVFGVFAILNYRFAPRFADLPDQRYWRAPLPDPLPDGVDVSPEQQAIRDYGPLEPIARNTINVAKIATQWPDMLRVAGSLVTNQVRAYDLLRMFGRDGHPTPLGQAFTEYGRIAKTLHLLALVDPIDGTYQRRMNRQLTVQESRHRLGRKICHGNRGQIRQAYREGQEDQLAALGLVLNAVVLWNTRYLDAIVEHLRGAASPCTTRMSPGCPRSDTRTSTASVAMPSPPSRRQNYDRCATRPRVTPRRTSSDRAPPARGSICGTTSAQTGSLPRQPTDPANRLPLLTRSGAITRPRPISLRQRAPRTGDGHEELGSSDVIVGRQIPRGRPPRLRASSPMPAQGPWTAARRATRRQKPYPPTERNQQTGRKRSPTPDTTRPMNDRG